MSEKQPTTRERDKAARGPGVRFCPPPPKMAKRCPKCHSRPGVRRWQGDRSIFLGLGVPCSLCCPIKSSDLNGLTLNPDFVTTFYPRSW